MPSAKLLLRSLIADAAPPSAFALEDGEAGDQKSSGSVASSSSGPIVDMFKSVKVGSSTVKGKLEENSAKKQKLLETLFKGSAC